ncbi:unnamed protein product, partial [Rotaria socialis]
MASELSANNPDLIESIRRNMGNREQPDGNIDGGPDGTSNGSSNPNNSSDQDKP